MVDVLIDFMIINAAQGSNKKILEAAIKNPVQYIFKKHNIEPIIVPLRHRYFWDGGLHCSSCDIHRIGDQQSVINYN